MQVGASFSFLVRISLNHVSRGTSPLTGMHGGGQSDAEKMGKRLLFQFSTKWFPTEAGAAQMGKRVRFNSRRITVPTCPAQMGDTQKIFGS
jgi:hypothetical protein